MAKEIAKSLYEQNFNYALNQESPVCPDFNRIVNVDSHGNEFITYEEVDYPTYQSSLGSWKDWSLDALVKAGIDPAFPIHTGYNTRLDGVADINAVSADVEAAFAAAEQPKDEN